MKNLEKIITLQEIDLPTTYNIVHHFVNSLIEDRNYDTAVKISTYFINHCPRTSTTFSDYLALSLSVTAITRMNKIGISRKNMMRQDMKFGKTFWMRRKIFKYALKKLSSYVDNIYKSYRESRLCPYCRTNTGDWTGKTTQMHERAFLYFDYRSIRDELLSLDIAFSKDDALHWVLNMAVKTGNFPMPILRCSVCHLEFIDWLFNSLHVASVYNRKLPDHVTDAMAGRAHVVGWNRSKTAFPIFVARTLKGVAGKTILDFGCAEGIMLWYLKQFGAQSTGLETNPYRTSYATEILGIPEAIHDETWLDDKANERRFDAVITYHTLEHLFDLAPTFDRFRRVLNPGGSLFICVPEDIGGAHTIKLTQDFLRHALLDNGFVLQGLYRDDESLPANLRDPVTQMPLWSGSSDTLAIAVRVNE